MEQQPTNPNFQRAADLLHRILTALCSKPQELRIAATLRTNKAAFMIVTAPEDMGLVIGRSGHMLRAIREIFQQLSKKDGLLYQVDLMVGSAQQPGVPAGTLCVHCRRSDVAGWWVVTETRSVCVDADCKQREALWMHRN